MKTLTDEELEIIYSGKGKEMGLKLSDEQKKELMTMVIGKLDTCNELLEDAYNHHCIAAGVAANDEA